MPHLVRLIAAARRARRVVGAARHGGYHREFAQLAAGVAGGAAQPCTRPVHADVRVLRALWRLSTANRRPDREPVFLAAALLAHGLPATLNIGRENAPPGREAHHLLWVSVNGTVVSTGLPVAEMCTPLAALPEPAAIQS